MVKVKMSGDLRLLELRIDPEAIDPEDPELLQDMVLAAVNEGLSPSQEELAWAHEFLADFEADGGEIRNGSDLPRKARAEKILGLAAAFGVQSTRYPDQDNAITAPSDTYHY